MNGFSLTAPLCNFQTFPPDKFNTEQTEQREIQSDLKGHHRIFKENHHNPLKGLALSPKMLTKGMFIMKP